MKIEEIEYILDQGGRVGFRKPTGDPEYLGWILIGKIRPHARLLEVFDVDEAPDLVREEQRRAREPYMVMRIELKRSVHESGDYETENDYRMKDRLWFPSLQRVESQLRDWGLALTDVEDARSLDAP